ncbi:hypothetical protein PMIN01_09020 [Paraphaeosphaeria minitans]|uniref:Uncharacterized protein n=1 Tax=Paraphaeosphaeria minitans TaxID=565426 RepID=A0A9P6GCT0_9PLEO|nr:hypothetical protein PMIN01_09020 [Paraphaeosphaeria minitans]
MSPRRPSTPPTAIALPPPLTPGAYLDSPPERRASPYLRRTGRPRHVRRMCIGVGVGGGDSRSARAPARVVAGGCVAWVVMARLGRLALRYGGGLVCTGRERVRVLALALCVGAGDGELSRAWGWGRVYLDGSR